MPNELGFYDSPGERRRRERFQATQTQVLETLAPVVEAGLERAQRGARLTLRRLGDAFTQDTAEATLEPLRARPGPPGREPFRPSTPTIPPAALPEILTQLTGRGGPPGREPFRETLSSIPADTSGLPIFGDLRRINERINQATGRLAELAVTGVPLGTALQAGREAGERLNIPVLGGIPSGLEAREFAEERGPLGLLEAEVEFGRPVTEPVGRFLGRGLGTQLEATPAGPLAAAAGIDLSEVGGQVGAVGFPEVAVLSNLVPVPIIDDALRIALKLGPELKAGARVAPDVLRGIRDNAARLINDPAVGGKARKLVDEISRLLPQERGAVTPPGGPVRELPPMRRLPEQGTFPAVRTDDGAIYFDPLGQGGNRTHMDIIREQGLPLERVQDGGFVIDGVYDPSVQSMVAALAERTRAATRRGIRRAEREAASALDVGPGAVEPAGAVPSGEAAQAPPIEPPPTSPTGGQLPERGTTGAQQALDLKEETLLRPGRATQLPGVRQAVSGLNPSVSIDRDVLVSYNAQRAVDATLETEFAATRSTVIDGFEAAWTAQPPTYTGPRNPATDYLNNTAKDFFENPELYTDVSPQLRAAVAAYDDISNRFLARFVGDYNGNIRPFTSEKLGWAYLPTVAARETLDESLLKVADGYTSSGLPTRTAISKPRVYETARERSLKNPKFRAETDLAELSSVHDRALAKMAGNETFRLGSGGRTRLDIMQELHPDLANRMIGLRQRLDNLRGATGRLTERTRSAIDDFLTAPDGDLGELADALDVKITRGLRKGQNVKAVNAEIRGVRQEIRRLQPAWKAANLEPFVLNRSTFRYHEAPQSAAIDQILRTKLNIGDGLLAAVDEVRLTAFAADVSPLTIQGLLGILSDPLTGARSLPGVRRALFSPEELLRITREEPELVQRFTQATGRPFGQLGTEFVQEARGIERIPSGRRVLERFPRVAGAVSRIPGAEQVISAIPGGRELNDSLMSAVELIRYNQWKTDTKIAQLGGAPQNVADAEASNALSKIIPALNAGERGVSVLQARVERLPFISTSFIGGPAAAMKDAASGLAKLSASRALSPKARWQELAGREQLAILHLSSIFGSIVTAGVVTHMLSGWSPEDALDAVINPKSPRFMSVALGKQRRIPLGGPLRSAAKAFIPQRVGEVKGVPIYVPFVGTAQWLQNKVTPALSTPIDIARNKDYWGGKIATGSFPENVLRTIWYAANNVLPLAAAEPSEAIRRGEVEPTDVGALAERAGAQLAGVDLRETSPFEELRFIRATVMSEMGLEGNFRDLKTDDPVAAARVDADERVQQQQAVLDRLPPRDVRGQAFDFIDTLRDRQRTEQEQDDARLGSGAINGNQWRGNLSDRGQRFFQSRQDLREFAGIEFGDVSAQEGSVGAATDAFFDINPDDFADPETGQIDWLTVDLLQDKALAPLSDAERDDFLRLILGHHDTPMQLRYRTEARPLRDQLAEIPRYTPFPVSLQTKLQDFRRDMLRAREERKNVVGSENVESVADFMRIIGPLRGFSENFIEAAIDLGSSRWRADNTSEQYENFIIANRDPLLLFYPDLANDRISDLILAVENATR
jgi:hypothetical protein